jgi:Mg-chelatase subunit ChlD
VARWLGDIREFFPTPVVRIIQRDAFERLNMKSLMLEPEFLSTLEADVHLVADLMSLRSAIPEKTKETARQVVRKVVQALMARLESRTIELLRGALNRSQRTRRPRSADIDWGRTIGANLRHYQAEHKSIVPETLIGHSRKSKTQANLDHVVLCIDQSGSMASSVVYASIFAAVMASVPGIGTKLICFDTAILDLTDQLSDPVEVLFGVQLGGGTDINAALAYCEQKIEQPSKTHLVLITDLFEGGDAQSMLARVASLKQSGVNVIVLLALSDDGHPSYNSDHAEKIAAMNCPVFACTPDQFPDLMATALTRQDIHQWAAAQDIALVRGA